MEIPQEIKFASFNIICGEVLYHTSIFDVSYSGCVLPDPHAPNVNLSL